MRDRKRKSGIRNYPTEDIDRVKEMVWKSIYDTIGRHRVVYLEVKPLRGDDPEVAAWIRRKNNLPG